MIFSKRDIYFGIVFILLIGFLFFFRLNLTGNVIWEPSTEVINCSDENVSSLWGEIFVESNTNINILKENVGVGELCEKFIAYKIKNEEEFYYLDYNESSFIMVWANITPLAVEEIQNMEQSYEAFINFEGLADGVRTREVIVENESIAEEEYLGKFKVDVGDFYDFFGIYIAAILENEKMVEGIVIPQDYLVYGYYTLVPLIEIKVVGEVEDYEFLKNSSWNYAFKLNDIFNWSNDGGVLYNMSYYGVNNTAGEYINWSINSSGVYFKPKTGFVGSREFELMLLNSTNNITSGKFNVTIVERFNSKPVIKVELLEVYISPGQTIYLDLDDYFRDSDKDSLSYSVFDKGEDIDLSVSGSNLSIKASVNFSDYSEFRIRASDGIDSISTDKIYVFEYNAKNDSKKDLGNESLIDVYYDNGSLINASSNSTGKKDDETPSDFRWIIWVLLVLIILAIIGILIYFLVLKKEEVQEEEVNPNVQNYLNELNDKK